MSLERQAALILICWVLAFWGIRSELSCISSYQLNKNAYTTDWIYFFFT